MALVIGAGAVVHGFFLAWEPAGWIVGGAIVAAAGAQVNVPERRR